jgi:Prolyl-tRNA synthetase
MKEFLSSYRDLPAVVYQTQTKFRNEKRPKSGILRGREFMMNDAYSFHASVEDLDLTYERMQKVYQKIFKDL